MKFIFAVLLFAVTTQAHAYQGIEECRNDAVGVHSIAHRLGGVQWIYTYAGIKYEIISADVLMTPADELPVEHVAETTTSLSCKDGEVENRTSVRTIVLRDANHQVVLKTDVQCEGRIATGLVLSPPSNPCQP